MTEKILVLLFFQVGQQRCAKTSDSIFSSQTSLIIKPSNSKLTSHSVISQFQAQTAMAEEPKPNSPHSLSDEAVKAPNIFQRAKEEIEAVIHAGKIHHFHMETHGKRNDIDANTRLDDVKAPNVFERAKEEIEALVEAIHHKNESHLHDDERDHSTKEEPKHEKPENDVKAPNLIERAKKEIEAAIHTGKAHFHKETHGKHDDSDENTPLDDAKGPNVFERAKEEIDALVETIHHKKESHTKDNKRDHSAKEKSENGVKAPSLIEKSKEKSPNHHHKETHGRNDDIDETTPVNEVKAPNVFVRAKEEVEAIIGAIHPKRESNDFVSSTK